MLGPDYTEELIQFSSTIQGEIISRMIASNQRVTGKTISSIEDEIRPTGVTIYAAPYIMVLDTGRGPTRQGNDGGPKLIDIIEQWIRDRGLIPTPTRKDGQIMDYNYRGMAFAISRRIHEFGSKLFNPGPPTGNILGVITDDRIDAFIGTFSKKFMDFVNSEIISSLEKS